MEENCGKGRMAFRPTSHPKTLRTPTINKTKALHKYTKKNRIKLLNKKSVKTERKYR